jgi:hypothetical protein
VGLVSNLIESQGIATLSIGTVRDIMTRVRAPRAVFVDHPVGQTFGRPGETRRHRQILMDALTCVPLFKRKGQILDLQHQWKDKSGRSWKKIVEREILNFDR